MLARNPVFTSLPVHYYSPVPNLRELHPDDATPRFLAAPPETLDAAMQQLEGLVEDYGTAFREIAERPPYGRGEAITEFRLGIAPYSTVEAETLYGLIRR